MIATIPMTRTLEARSPAFSSFLQAATLEAVSLEGQEGVNGLFEYAVTVQTLDGLHLAAAGVSRWDLDAFLGCPLNCRIELGGVDPLPTVPVVRAPGTTGFRSSITA